MTCVARSRYLECDSTSYCHKDLAPSMCLGSRWPPFRRSSAQDETLAHRKLAQPAIADDLAAPGLAALSA